MALVYGDLHIHIGRTKEGKAVKITASPALTLENIIRAAEQKGLRLVGIVDAACRGRTGRALGFGEHPNSAAHPRWRIPLG